jgi:hypothetical protein
VAAFGMSETSSPGLFGGIRERTGCAARWDCAAATLLLVGAPSVSGRPRPCCSFSQARLSFPLAGRRHAAQNTPPGSSSRVLQWSHVLPWCLL